MIASNQVGFYAAKFFEGRGFIEEIVVTDAIKKAKEIGREELNKDHVLKLSKILSNEEIASILELNLDYVQSILN